MPTSQQQGNPTAARQQTLREHNLSLVARAIFAAQGQISRADVAQITGLSRATVSSLVDQLVAGDVLTEGAPVLSSGPGRPSVPLAPAPQTIVSLGLEVNVSYLGAVLMDLTGEILDERVEPGFFHDSNPREVLERLGSLARDLLQVAEGRRFRVAGASLALPGLVDARTGLLQLAPNLGWHGVDPVPPLELGELPVKVANDAKLAAMAELGGEAPSSFLFVAAEVGIGAAIMVDGTLFQGERGWNGELGHVVVDSTGPRCACGAFGCLEQYAGKEALLYAAGIELADGLPALVEALEADDERALVAVARAATGLASALADFVNLVDVSTVILGGIYAELLPWIADSVSAALNFRVLSAPFAPVVVMGATTGSYAAMIGGAREVLADVIANPAPWV